MNIKIIMSFTKIFKIAADDAKQTVSRSIKNDVPFCCQLVNISNCVGEDVEYPEYKDMCEWMRKLFAETFVPKPLNEKALAAMKSKGLTPGKSPRDLFCVVISGSETHVHVGVSIPESLSQDNDVEQFVKCFMEEREYEFEIVNDSAGKFLLLSHKSDSPLKERDFILQNAFNELKKRKIYIDDNDDDVIYGLEEL